MRRLVGGERERHLRAMGDATSSPGRTRAASPAIRSRPGPTTVKGIKAKMPRWRAARRGCTASAPNIRSNPDTPPGVIRALRPVGAPSPSIARETEEEKCGRPPGPEPKQGLIFFCRLQLHPKTRGLFDN